MRPAFIALIVLWCGSFNTYGQIDPGGGRISGMGNAQVAVTDLFSANQGSLALLKHHEVGMYTRQRFMLKELSQYYLHAAFVSKWGNFGLRSFRSGHEQLNNTQLGLAYGKQLFRNFSAGAQINMHQYNIVNHGTNTLFSVDIGFRTKLSENISLGAHLQNPSASSIQKETGLRVLNKPNLSLGFAYENGDFLLSSELVKTANNLPPTLKIGTEYRFYEALFVRMGISTSPAAYSGGLGIYWNQLKIDLAYNHHPQLGHTPGISLSYLFEKHEK